MHDFVFTDISAISSVLFNSSNNDFLHMSNELLAAASNMMIWTLKKFCGWLLVPFLAWAWRFWQRPCRRRAE
jgi:hypothetical protein